MPVDASAELSKEALQFAQFMADKRVPSTDLEALRAKMETIHLAATEPEGVTYREVELAGVRAIWCEPLGADTSYVLLHNHAGGSVVTSAFVDRKLAGHIAKATGIPALVVDWRRAPEHPYPAQLDDLESVYRALVASGTDPARIISIGHSIGGFLAAALAIRLRDSGDALPGAIVSISPWCDLEIANPSIEANADTDSVLTRAALERFRSHWIDGTGLEYSDVRINLNTADLTGLPPTLVSWGTYEILAGEDEIFAARLESAGVEVSTLPLVGGQHSYVWSAGRVPETDQAIHAIAAWVKGALGIEAR